MTTSPKVVLVSIDGMRPDGLQQAKTPTIDRLIEQGYATMTARTVMPCITFPCHNSMFRSVPPARHGITSNVWTPMARPVPSLMERLAARDKACAMFYNWEVLRDLAKPETLKASFYVADDYGSQGSADREVAQYAASWLNTHQWDFAFVYLGYTDLAGHDSGWMSPAYLAAIQNADQCLSHVLASVPDDCWVMVVSDHGGEGQNHGEDIPTHMTIPLVIAPNRGVLPEGAVWHGESDAQIIDVAPTLLRLFDIQPPYEWVGKPLVTFD